MKCLRRYEVAFSYLAPIMAKNRVIFFIHKEVHILDLAGAVQAFYEAGYYGHPYDIVYVSDSPGQTEGTRVETGPHHPLVLETERGGVPRKVVIRWNPGW